MPLPIPDDEEQRKRILGLNPALLNLPQAAPLQPAPPVGATAPTQPNINPALLQQPTTIPIPIKPDQYASVQPGPAQANLEAMQVPIEQPISRGRRALAAIGGGFAGFSNPKAGVEVAQELLHGPYNRELEQYGRKLDLSKLQAGEESKRQDEGIRRATAESGSQYKAGELGIKAGELANKQNVTDIRRSRVVSLNDLDTLKKDPAYQSMLHPNKDIEFANFWNTLTPEEQKQVSDAERAKHPQPSIEDTKAKAKAHTEGVNEATVEPSGRLAATVHPTAAIAATGTPEALKAEQAKTEATTTGRIKAETDPEMIARQAQLAHAKSVALVSMNEKDTAHSAQIALTRFPDIEAALPKASDKMFGNRWQDFMTGTIGQDPEFAPLRTDIGMLQSLVAKIHIGSRGSSHIMQKFEGLFNAKSMDKDTLTASLKEIKKWIEVYSKMPNVQGGVDLGDVDKAVEGKKKSIFDIFTPVPTGGKQ